jgi:hypothetical protein
LVRWSDEGGPCSWSPFQGKAYVQPLLIDRDREEAAAGGGQDDALEGIAGLLDPNGVSRIKEHAGRDIERLLRPGDHHDLIGLTFDAASSAEIIADRIAEALRTAWINMVDCAGIGIPGVAQDEVRPDFERKLVQRRLMNAK